MSESDSDGERRLRELGHRVGSLDLSFVEGATLWSRHYDLDRPWAADLEAIIAAGTSNHDSDAAINRTLDRRTAIELFLMGTREAEGSA